MKQWKQIGGKVRLLGILILLPIMVYFFGWRNTLRVWMDYRTGMRLNVDTSFLDPGPELSRYSLLSDGKFLRLVDSLDSRNEVSVVKYTPMLTLRENGVQVYTGELVMTGGFIPLLRLADGIEKNCKGGKVASAMFHIFRDPQGRKEQLRLVLYVQQITEDG